VKRWYKIVVVASRSICGGPRGRRYLGERRRHDESALHLWSRNRLLAHTYRSGPASSVTRPPFQILGGHEWAQQLAWCLSESSSFIFMYFDHSAFQSKQVSIPAVAVRSCTFRWPAYGRLTSVFTSAPTPALTLGSSHVQKPSTGLL